MHHVAAPGWWCTVVDRMAPDAPWESITVPVAGWDDDGQPWTTWTRCPACTDGAPQLWPLHRHQGDSWVEIWQWDIATADETWVARDERMRTKAIDLLMQLQDALAQRDQSWRQP